MRRLAYMSETMPSGCGSGKPEFQDGLKPELQPGPTDSSVGVRPLGRPVATQPDDLTG
jgi:hypothetical protein